MALPWPDAHIQDKNTNRTPGLHLNIKTLSRYRNSDYIMFVLSLFPVLAREPLYIETALEITQPGPGPHLNIKTVSLGIRIHMTRIRLSYLYYGNPYTGKTTSLYWGSPLAFTYNGSIDIVCNLFFWHLPHIHNSLELGEGWHTFQQPVIQNYKHSIHHCHPLYLWHPQTHIRYHFQAVP